MKTLSLSSGPHKNPEDGTCLMEAASILMGEDFSDNPSCVDPLIRYVGMALNDSFQDKDRDELVPFIFRVVGTKNNEYCHDRIKIVEKWILNMFEQYNYMECYSTTDLYHRYHINSSKYDDVYYCSQSYEFIRPISKITDELYTEYLYYVILHISTSLSKNLGIIKPQLELLDELCNVTEIKENVPEAQLCYA